MEIYEIKYLNCDKKENMFRLIKEVKGVIGDRPATKESLEKICKAIVNKYGLEFRMIVQGRDRKTMVSMETARSEYSTFECSSYYEILCKYILISRLVLKYKREINGYGRIKNLH